MVPRLSDRRAHGGRRTALAAGAFLMLMLPPRRMATSDIVPRGAFWGGAFQFCGLEVVSVVVFESQGAECASIDGRRCVAHARVPIAFCVDCFAEREYVPARPCFEEREEGERGGEERRGALPLPLFSA